MAAPTTAHALAPARLAPGGRRHEVDHPGQRGEEPGHDDDPDRDPREPVGPRRQRDAAEDHRGARDRGEDRPGHPTAIINPASTQSKAVIDVPIC
jgi:hypothetical protein